MEVRHAAVEGGDTAAASGQELDRRCSAPASPSRERRRRPRGRWLLECARVGDLPPAGSARAPLDRKACVSPGAKERAALKALGVQRRFRILLLSAAYSIYQRRTREPDPRTARGRAVRFYNPVAGTIPNPGPGRRDRFRRSGKRPRGGAGRGDGRRMRLRAAVPRPAGPAAARGAGLTLMPLIVKA